MRVPTLADFEIDVAHALEHINIPSYLVDAAGVIRWLNPAGRRLVGDVDGRQFTSVVAAEDTRRAREMFARKLLGSTDSADAPVVLRRRLGQSLRGGGELGAAGPRRAGDRHLWPGL